MNEDLKALLEIVKETIEKHNINYCCISFTGGWTIIDIKKESQSEFSSISLKENGEFFEI